MQKDRHRAFPLVVSLLLIGVLLSAALPVQRVLADPPGTLAGEPESIRQQLYAELQQEAEAYERFAGIIKKVVRLVTPTVVHIDSLKRTTAVSGRYGGVRPSIEEAGSGVIISIEGRLYVLTNRHVVNNSDLAQLDIRLHTGELLTPVRIWDDPGTDVAVVEIEQQGLTPARLGDSDQVAIGETVLAIGSPFGLSHSVTAGIISAKGRRQLDLGNTDGLAIQDFLQTDAAINPGNSGGPLVNLRGEVVAINTAIASNSGGNEGIGFAIPINMAIVVARQLVKTGHVSHAYLGVRLENGFGPKMARDLGLGHIRGALVKGITPNSPAHRAKLQVNDLIVRFDDVPVEDDVHLVNLVSLTPIGQLVTLHIIRNGQPVVVEVRVGQRSDFEDDVRR